MFWPSDQDYNEAVQNPQSAFQDSELKVGEVETLAFGIPKPRAGNFAAVYKVVVNGSAHAAKCFRRDTPEYGERYEAIARHLKQHSLPYFVSFRYMSQGIRVGSAWYPLLKMRWIEGEPLITFIERNLNSPSTLTHLAASWVRLLNDLQKAKIAHGDLQHGNVLVVGGELKLVDYDGMYVPELRGKHALEIGHINYQHPERTALDYDLYLDNFSAWLIYACLVALSHRPELWHQLKSGDDCLLFRKQDLITPEQSNAFRLLKAVPNENVRDIVERVEEFLWLPPSRVPLLTEIGVPPQLRDSSVATPRLAEWIADHVQSGPQSPAIASTERDEANEIGDLSWVQDHVQEAVPGSSFQNTVSNDRLIAVALYSVILGLAAWLSLGVGLLATIGIWVGGVVVASGAALLCWLYRYRREPIFASLRTIHAELRAENRAVDAARAKHENLKNERKQRRANYSAELLKLQTKRNALQTDEAMEISRIDNARKEMLYALHERRRSLSAEESNEKRQLADRIAVLSHQISAVANHEQNEVTQLDQSVGTRIRGYEVQLQQMMAKRDLELRHALRYYQDEIVNSHLHRQRLADATISGIGEELKRRLAQAGYVSAGDIGTRNIAVQGIGSKKWDALNSWRLALDSNIRSREAPQSLPSHRAAAIEQRYENPIKQLQQSLAYDKGQFASLSTGIKQKYAEQKRLLDTRLRSEEIDVARQTSLVETKFEGLRKVVSIEEQNAGLQSDKAIADCKSRFHALIAVGTTETEQLQKIYANDLEKFNHQLEVSTKSVREMSWRRDRVSRARVAYAPFTFGRYCARVLGARRKE